MDYQKQSLPNSTGALVLGIISIPTCFCYGFVGMACGIIALVLASKGSKLYKEFPENYTLSSYNNLNAGRICGIVGVSLSGIYLLFILFYIAVYGTLAFSFLNMMENANQIQ